jgi:hypothetical protein
VLALHYQALKDLNENRLSKFEFALYIQKLLEFFVREGCNTQFTQLTSLQLTDDVAYNYVEHFYTTDRFRPGFLPYK